ncbi:MAG: hypothetical protein HRU28_11165, partial [Rhizobiales bacterium]|nr:hypothetical protein [Hyphomicrobiales bacterium]
MTETFDLSKKTYHTNIFFRHVVQRMGLSTKGAGILLNIQENTISKWVTGKNFPPAGVFKE